MWRDHPFSQRNKTTKGAVEVKIWGVGQWKKIENEEARQYRGVLINKEGLQTLCQLPTVH